VTHVGSVSSLEAKIHEAARAAARADIAAGGGVEHGAMTASLLAKAVKARQDGKSKDEFFASLSPKEREYLGV
jgi:hypothetical protein